MAIILAIEDNPLVLCGMTMLLESWGHDVIGVTSSQEALERLRTSPTPDVIISDYRLNDGGTGIDAVHEIIRMAGHEVPAMIVTGENVLAEVECWGLPVLRKPISPEGLRRELTAAIG